jgi:hypothetical protein
VIGGLRESSAEGSQAFLAVNGLDAQFFGHVDGAFSLLPHSGKRLSKPDFCGAARRKEFSRPLASDPQTLYYKLRCIRTAIFYDFWGWLPHAQLSVKARVSVNQMAMAPKATLLIRLKSLMRW